MVARLAPHVKRIVCGAGAVLQNDDFHSKSVRICAVNNHAPVASARRRRFLRAIGGGCAMCGLAIAALAQTPPAPPRRTYDLRIEQRKLVAGPATVRATKGDIVELRWTTDEATSIHLHGYNIEARLDPGKPGLMTIVATATGRFPLAAHGFGAPAGHRDGKNAHRETTLMYLEVYPR